jgi:hypothetical protein
MCVLDTCNCTGSPAHVLSCSYLYAPPQEPVHLAVKLATAVQCQGPLVVCRSSILPSAFTQPIMIREDTEYLSFGDGSLTHAPGATALRGTSGAGGSGGREAAAVPSAADETGPLPMYEDTQFLTGPAASSGGQLSGTRGRTGSGGSLGDGDDTAGLLVREDTCFLPDAPVAGETEQHCRLHPLSQTRKSMPRPCMHEDNTTGSLPRHQPDLCRNSGTVRSGNHLHTSCKVCGLRPAAASAALEQTSGLQLYEDTGFLSENLAPQPAGPQAVSSHPVAAASAALEQTGGLQLYEDTGLLTENLGLEPAGPQAASSHPAAAASPASAPARGLQLHEDTVFLSENVAPQPTGRQAVSFHRDSAAAAALDQTSSLQLREDTGLLTESVAPQPLVRSASPAAAQPPTAAPDQHSSSQQVRAHAVLLHPTPLQQAMWAAAAVWLEHWKADAQSQPGVQTLPSSLTQEFDGEAENQPPAGAASQPLLGLANGHTAKPPLQACHSAALWLPVA